MISENPEETFLIGKIIGENLTVTDVVALIGELGTGKTCLTQGIARGIGIPERFQITSPSFTLINEYQGRVMLYHFDLYRLAGSRDIEVMEYEEYFFGEGVSVIEWADKIKDILPEQTLFISFKYLDENKREIVIFGDKQKVMKISDALKSGGL
ncbi:MAG TPA: tRNA (adenosine(37)-N6)-threonylcarbamoyltransferase complex ATPase subunit type 1 TsaE [Syntrophales bacterium]|nr:tRNA (adenosine(37)-N6)-threonylcarbamoyltransferase complex ATPase subunit type 1 TsaE [Syntrophales bacterium]